MKNLRGAKPIPNPLVKKFITDFKRTELIYDNDILDKFKSKFVSWIRSSKNNKLDGLEVYHNISYIHGTVQAFDHFYLIQKRALSVAPSWMA